MGGTSDSKYLDRALVVLSKNWKTGEKGGKSYGFSCPSIHEYRRQWFWDSCFHAIIQAPNDAKRAESELRGLIDSQREDGRIPHMSFWTISNFFQAIADPIATRAGVWTKDTKDGLATSGFIQPPVIAVALEELYLQTKEKGLLEELLPPVEDFYSYLRDNRDPDQDGLISIIHPFESGADQSPAMRVPFGTHKKKEGKKRKKRTGISALWGNQMKLQRKHYKSGWDIEECLEHYDLESVMMNSIYAWNLRSLASMNGELDRTKEEGEWNELADRVEEAIIEQMWDEERNIFVDEYQGQQSEIIYIGSLLPLLFDTIEQDKVNHLVEWLTDESEFWTRYPIPVVPQSSEHYNPGRDPGDLSIWGRGNAWINMNWMVWLGLEKQAQRFEESRYKEIADTLRERTLELVSLDGYELHEYYNSETGKSYGPKDFGWSGLFAVDPKIRNRGQD